MNRLREKTATTLLIAIFMISTLSVMSIGAPADGYTEAVLNAADRLTAEQNTGDSYPEGYIGGFRMWISETPPGTYLRTHNIGVTAIGILKAHELQDKPEYETALAMAYKFVVDHEPGWVGYPISDPTYWKESPGGVNSWPDIHFLIDLADAAALDSSLLAAIQGEVSGTTADGIVALAKARWDDRLNHAGAIYPSETGTATGMADWLVGVRLGTWESLIPWDLEAAVKSAVALHEKYPEDGYLVQAQDIAEVIYDCIYVEDPPYLDRFDPEEKCYTLGLAGAIEAFTEAGLYPNEASELKALLIDYQSANGYWDASDLSDQESVQSTAYAIMALLAQGDNDARVSALEGIIWLIDTQDELGGWDPSSLGSGDENLEVDGEAAWALSECIPVAKLPRNIDPLYQVGLYQRMELALTITGKAGSADVTIEGPFYYRGVDDADASWHAVLVVKSSTYDRAEPGDEVLCHWKYLEEISNYGWIINAKGFNMHLYPTGPRVGDTPQDGESWRYKQPVEGKSYGATVTGFLYQIGIPPN